MLLTGSETGVLKIFNYAFNMGIVFKPWHLKEIFLTDGVTYIISLFIISTIKYQFSLSKHNEETSLLTRLKAGFEFLLERKPLLIFGTSSLTVFLTVIVSNYMMAPTYIYHRLKGDASIFGAMEISFAAGAIAAGLFVRTVTRYISEVNAVLYLIALCFLLFIGLLFNQSIALFLLLMMIYGLCNAGVRILRVTYIFHHVPNHIFGRTGGVFLMIHILLRMLFIAMFSMPQFSAGNNILYAYFVFALLLLLSAASIRYFRNNL